MRAEGTVLFLGVSVAEREANAKQAVVVIIAERPTMTRRRRGKPHYQLAIGNLHRKKHFRNGHNFVEAIFVAIPMPCFRLCIFQSVSIQNAKSLHTAFNSFEMQLNHKLSNRSSALRSKCAFSFVTLVRCNAHSVSIARLFD